MAVDVETTDGVTVITLNRPDKKNAVTQPMYLALTDALKAAAADDGVKVVLLQGAGADFSAGNDIADFMAVTANKSADRFVHVRDFLHVLPRFEKPLVAAVQGVAIGIGFTVLLHCDLVFVAEDARMAAPFASLGLTPEAGSGLLLPALVGHPKAFAIFTLGEAIDGRTAAAIGIASHSLPADQVKARALDAARLLATRSPTALKATKAMMRRPAETLDQIDRELVAFEAQLLSPEAAAAFAAFSQRSK